MACAGRSLHSSAAGDTGALGNLTFSTSLPNRPFVVGTRHFCYTAGCATAPHSGTAHGYASEPDNVGPAGAAGHFPAGSADPAVAAAATTPAALISKDLRGVAVQQTGAGECNNDTPNPTQSQLLQVLKDLSRKRLRCGQADRAADIGQLSDALRAAVHAASSATARNQHEASFAVRALQHAPALARQLRGTDGALLRTYAASLADRLERDAPLLALPRLQQAELRLLQLRRWLQSLPPETLASAVTAAAADTGTHQPARQSAMHAAEANAVPCIDKALSAVSASLKARQAHAQAPQPHQPAGEHPESTLIQRGEAGAEQVAPRGYQRAQHGPADLRQALHELSVGLMQGEGASAYEAALGRVQQCLLHCHVLSQDAHKVLKLLSQAHEESAKQLTRATLLAAGMSALDSARTAHAAGRLQQALEGDMLQHMHTYSVTDLAKAALVALRTHCVSDAFTQTLMTTLAQRARLLPAATQTSLVEAAAQRQAPGRQALYQAVSQDVLRRSARVLTDAESQAAAPLRQLAGSGAGAAAAPKPHASTTQFADAASASTADSIAPQTTVGTAVPDGAAGDSVAMGPGEFSSTALRSAPPLQPGTTTLLIRNIPKAANADTIAALLRTSDCEGKWVAVYVPPAKRFGKVAPEEHHKRRTRACQGVGFVQCTDADAARHVAAVLHGSEMYTEDSGDMLWVEAAREQGGDLVERVTDGGARWVPRHALVLAPRPARAASVPEGCSGPGLGGSTSGAGGGGGGSSAHQGAWAGARAAAAAASRHGPAPGGRLLQGAARPWAGAYTPTTPQLVRMASALSTDVFVHGRFFTHVHDTLLSELRRTRIPSVSAEEALTALTALCTHTMHDISQRAKEQQRVQAVPRRRGAHAAGPAQPSIHTGHGSRGIHRQVISAELLRRASRYVDRCWQRQERLVRCEPEGFGLESDADALRLAASLRSTLVQLVLVREQLDRAEAQEDHAYARDSALSAVLRGGGEPRSKTMGSEGTRAKLSEGSHQAMVYGPHTASTDAASSQAPEKAGHRPDGWSSATMRLRDVARSMLEGVLDGPELPLATQADLMWAMARLAGPLPQKLYQDFTQQLVTHGSDNPPTQASTPIPTQDLTHGPQAAVSDPVAPRGLLFGQTVSILDDGPALPSQPQQSQLRQPRRERSVRSIGDRAALPAEQLARVAWVLGKARHELTWRVPELCELIARQAQANVTQLGGQQAIHILWCLGRLGHHNAPLQSQLLQQIQSCYQLRHKDLQRLNEALLLAQAHAAVETPQSVESERAHTALGVGLTQARDSDRSLSGSQMRGVETGVASHVATADEVRQLVHLVQKWLASEWATHEAHGQALSQRHGVAVQMLVFLQQRLDGMLQECAGAQRVGGSGTQDSAIQSVLLREQLVEMASFLMQCSQTGHTHSLASS